MNLPRLVAAAPTLRLGSARLVLRRFGPDDVATAIEHEQDRTMMRWIRDAQPLDAVVERSTGLAAPWLGLDGEWLALAIVPDGRPAMVGIVVCRVTVAANETMEIGYRLQPDVHRRGYGFEACTMLCEFLFAEIGVRKLVAYCVAENEPSWRLMEKLGMRREAHTVKDSLHRNRGWLDGFTYALLADEWRASRDAR